MEIIKRPASFKNKPSVFISYCSKDKKFAIRLSNDLKALGLRIWIDEGEIKIGDSLIDKIRNGIDNVDYLLVILTPFSVKSEWVKREVDIAMNEEIENRRIKVLPLLLKKCALPGFLKGKQYADFRDPTQYMDSLFKILARFKTDFNFNITQAKRAAKAAGLLKNDLLNVSDGSASSIAYSLNNDKEAKRWLTFDLGGGTLDATLIKKEYIDKIDKRKLHDDLTKMGHKYLKEIENGEKKSAGSK